MEPRNTNDRNKGHHVHPLRNEIGDKERERTVEAHEQAEKDMNEDAELTAHNPLEDLDEGEAARLTGDATDIV